MCTLLRWSLLGIALLVCGGILLIQGAVAGEDAALLTIKVSIIDSRERGQHYQGEPLYVDVVLRRPEGTKPELDTLRLGTEKDPWNSHVAIRLCKIDETPPSKETQAKSVPVEGISIKPWDMMGPAGQELQAIGVVRASWAVDPLSTATLAAGKYRVEVSLDTRGRKETEPKSFQGKCQADSDVITINESKDINAKSEILAAQGRYLMFSGRFEEAIQVYSEALKVNPAKGDVHCNLGRAQELKGDIGSAIKNTELM